MATVLIHQQVPRQTPTPPLQTPPLCLNISHSKSLLIPNKHLPYGPTDPVPRSERPSPATPPDSPPTRNSSLRTFSKLHPADTYPRIASDPPVYSIDVPALNAAIREQAAQALPQPTEAFPWLHGLHSENQVQVAFFGARRKTQHYTPKCFRGITIIKAGGNLDKARLKGALCPEEVLDIRLGRDPSFIEVDPKEGFSIRNFQIQASKMCVVSDIVIYGDSHTHKDDVLRLAQKFSVAQTGWRTKSSNDDDHDAPVFNTFVLSSEFPKMRPQLIGDLNAEKSSSAVRGDRRKSP